MTKVRLKGLSIYQRRGKWYVYYRHNGRALIQGFEGTRDDLNKEIEKPAFFAAYAEVADQPKAKGFGTLGGLIDFYKTKKKWKKLAPRTQADYQKVFDWLEAKGQMKTLVKTIKPKHMVLTRDKAAEDKYLKFSNDALSVLSAAFKTGITYDYAGLTVNPVRDIERLKPDEMSKSANRRWTKQEWDKTWQIVPPHIRPVLALAKHAGMRGQDIAVLRWDNITEASDGVKFLRYKTLKNKVDVCLIVGKELQSALDMEEKTTLTICKNSLGRPFPSENAMRKAWQDFKASPIFDKSIPTGADLTLHGLRVTFASELKERGFSNQEIARALGDKTERMGGHYSRGADDEHFARHIAMRF